MDMVDKIKSVEEIAKELSAKVRWSSGYGQYENDSAEQRAYIVGVTTAIGMMYIDLTGSPKTVGMLQQDRQQLLDAVCEVLEGLEIVSKPELKMVNPHIQTWEDGYRFALDDAKNAIKKLLDDNK